MKYADIRAIRARVASGYTSEEERQADAAALEEYIRDKLTADIKRWEEGIARYGANPNYKPGPKPSGVDAETAQLLSQVRGAPSPLDIGWRRGGDWGHFSDREHDS